MQGAERKVYRAAFAICSSIVVAAFFVIIGVAMVVSADQVGVSGLIVGVIALFGGIAIGAITFCNRLVVDADNIVYWHNFRRRVIPWADVRAFTIGASRSFVRWPCVVIATDSGRIRVDAVAGTKKYVEKAIAELTAKQGRYVKA
jgi:hypothetical protein